MVITIYGYFKAVDKPKIRRQIDRISLLSIN